MHQLDAGRIVNLKPSRVGGLREAVKIHNYCYENGIPLWVGGMLETGIGRTVSTAVASLPGVTLPSDLSATSMYYQPDITDPPYELDPATSTIPVQDVTVNRERLAAAAINIG
jgi:O-succinylbenzoate synthase